MRHSTLLTLAVAAPRHVRYELAGPAPAWTFGIEYGNWENASDPVY